MLERMASALIALEAAPDDQSAIDAIFREAHTMKGTAGMVGMMRLSHLAHRLEDLLTELRSGTRRSTPELTDAMLRVVDGMGRLVVSTSHGEDGAADEVELERMLPASAPADILLTERIPKPSVAVTKHAAPPPKHEPKRAPQPVVPKAAAPISALPSDGAVGPASASAPPVSDPAPPAPDAPLARDRRRLDAVTLAVPVARIDELNRLVGEASAAQLRVGQVLGQELRSDPDTVNEYRELTKVLNQLQEVSERTRMVPIGTLEPILHRTVRDAARHAGKSVRWEITGDDVEIDRSVLEQLAAPLQHLVRNSVGHGIELPARRLALGKPEEGVVKVHAAQVGSKVVITITDDGSGIDVAAVRAAAAAEGVDVTNLDEVESVRLILRSGVSTATEVTADSGRGVGLDVVSSAVTAVRGRLEIENHPGSGSEFRIVVPITLTIVPCLIVAVAGQPFALPMERITRMLGPQPVHVVGGRRLAMIEGQAVPVADLASLIGMSAKGGGPWVILGVAEQQKAFRVDTVLQKRDVVVRGLTGRLRDLHVISGASVEPNGSILLVLDVVALIERSERFVEPAVSITQDVEPPPRAPSVLVVDDSLMVRELQRSILERAGYDVRTANDGREALTMLAEQPPDLVVTDIEMPNVDGIELTLNIRSHPRLANIPVLIVTSHTSEEDRQRGLDAGADALIVKTAFDEAGLLNAVSRLLGESGGLDTDRNRAPHARATAAKAPPVTAGVR
jgi:two-component system, chemotaxis family, sensor kinase CheA